MGIATDIILLVVAAFLFGLLFQRIEQPVILGYIAAGVVLGPHTGGLTVSSRTEVDLLAELGVTLLLFGLGLEFSLKELSPIRKVVLLGTPLQIIFTVALGAGLGSLWGWDLPACIWFGALLAPSSTMVLLKTLMSQGWLGTLSSKVMIGILIVQDLAVIPLMLGLPHLANPSAAGYELAAAGAKALVFLAVCYWGGRRVVPLLMRHVARAGSRELFLLAVAALGLGLAYATHLIGLSFATGAFVAGMLLRETDYGHQALSDIIPLRDFFGLLFFASVGMLLDPAFLTRNWPQVLTTVLAISVGKGLLFALIVRLFGYGNVVPLAVGLGMFQVGEFAFVLAAVGQRTGAISQHLHELVLNVAVITMLLTPIISQQTSRIYAQRRRFLSPEPHKSVNLPEQAFKEHVIIVGAGRVGRQIANGLEPAGVPFVFIESDQQQLELAQGSRAPLIYGDASHEALLEAAHIASARLLIVTVPDIVTCHSVISRARHMNSEVGILVRTSEPEYASVLHGLSAADVVLPEFEAGLEMTRRALSRLHPKRP